MAIAVFLLTKKQRTILSMVFVTLSMIQVVTGVVMLTISMYIYISVAPVLFSERAEVSYVFAVIGVCGFNNICCWTYGLKIRQKCLKQAHKKSSRNLVFAWTCVGFYIIMYLVVLAKLTRRVYKHLIRAMGRSFYIGISKYLKEETWKINIDRIQYDLQCCGSKGYKEWYEVPWLDKYHVNMKSESVKQFQNGTSFPIVPWSCCRLNFAMQCLHDPLQQFRTHTAWTDQHSVIEESLNTDGCLSKLKIPIKWSLTGFILLVVINCILQLLIFLIVRILYTSCRNATLMNDPDGIAPGWIFGRGDCGYNRGKTLNELMQTRRRKGSSPRGDEEKQLIDTHDN